MEVPLQRRTQPPAQGSPERRPASCDEGHRRRRAACLAWRSGGKREGARACQNQRDRVVERGKEFQARERRGYLSYRARPGRLWRGTWPHQGVLTRIAYPDGSVRSTIRGVLNFPRESSVRDLAVVCALADVRVVRVGGVLGRHIMGRKIHDGSRDKRRLTVRKIGNQRRFHMTPK